MKVRFWGVRGSIPAPGPETIKYGGNTPCIEIRGDNNELIVVDSGTGVRKLGLFLMKYDLKMYGELNVNLFLTHTHWDHIQGFPFFVPIYLESTHLTVWGPSSHAGSLSTIVAGQMNFAYFPVKLDEIKAEIDFRELSEEEISLNNFKISTIFLNHPIPSLGYRIEYGSKAVVTIYDHEERYNLFRLDLEKRSPEELEDIDLSWLTKADEFVEQEKQRIIDFMRNANLVIYDAQYTKEEYESKRGWGHSTVDQALEAAIAADVEMVALYHHDPARTDAELDELQNYVKGFLKARKRTDILAFFAREKMEIPL